MENDQEKVVRGPDDKWGLTSKGAAALGTGLVALPVLEGIAHLGPLGIVLAAGATLIAFRHGHQFHAKGKALLEETIQRPASSSREDRRQPMSKATPARTSNEGIFIGQDRRGKEVRRALSELKSILILGVPGQGKSSTASWLLAQIIEQGGRIVIIDRHARSDESLSAMLSPFEAAFLQPPAYEPESARDTLQYADDTLQSRMSGEQPRDVPFILVIDEMTDILKKLSQKSPWGDVARAIADVVEGFNAMGRKYNCFALCVGQLTNASRTGGTEIRELFSTRLTHAMQESQARLILPKEIASVVPNLEQGEIIADFEGKEDPFQVKVPQLSRASIQKIAASIERDPIEELAEMEDVDPDDSRYADDDEEIIPIGRDNRTKQEIGIPKQTFDMLVRMRKAGNTQVSGYRGIQELLDCTETHARNINKLIDEECEAGRESEREG